ncbi:MAG: T9SS type A sorting domain-containing protein [Bacteroidota bacterium]
MKNKLYLLLVLVSIFHFNASGQCERNSHTPFEQDSWLSCQMSANPNPERPMSHWIMYDLGWEYVLDSTRIWNYNVWGNSGLGVKDLAIDYSSNGTNWTNLGTFTIEWASASYKYQGVAGPSFDKVPARYVLLTAIDSWEASTCVGFSEIRFNLDQSTSIAPDFNEDLAMVVHPNPVLDEAQISFKANRTPDRMVLYDLSGRKIFEQKEINAMNVTVDMQTLVGGIYVIKAWFDDSLLSAKIVKVN